MNKIIGLSLIICLMLCFVSCGTKDTERPDIIPETKTDLVESTVTVTDIESEDIGDNIESADESLVSEQSTISVDSSHVHSYNEKITKKATCTEKGVKTHTCQCGYTYTEAIPLSSHNWGEWKITTQPTETAAGVSKRECSVCKRTDSKSVPKIVSPQSNSVVTATQIKSIEDGFFSLVNAERNKRGVAPLSVNSSLDSWAQVRSGEIIDLFSHTRPNGKGFESVIDQNVYDYIMCGENICMTSHIGEGYYTQADRWVGSNTQIEAASAAIFNCFKNSPPHYSSMINGEYKECGIGISFVMKEDDIFPMFYVAHIFGTK